MNSNLKMIAFVPVLLMAFAPTFAATQDMKDMDMSNMKMSCQRPKLSTNEVKALIADAKTAQDHHKLACYFSAEARDEAAKAKYHEEMARLYEGSTNEKHDMAEHCKQFASDARKAADSDNQLAAEHEKMAEQAK
jgi:hypothetical protein